MILRFTPGARREFLSAIRYIRADDPIAAQRFRTRCEEVLLRLVDFPDSGRRLPEFPDLPHREVVIPPYSFFYRVVDEVVWVVAVWHGARLPNEPESP